MKLCELFRRVKWEKVLPILKDRYDIVGDLSDYEKAFYNIKKLMPTYNSEIMTIELKWDLFPSSDSVPDTACEVVGKKDDENDSYALEFELWTDWIGMDVSNSTLFSLSEEEIVAHCLYEMTFLGYNIEDVLVRKDEIYERIDSAMREIADTGIENLKTIEEVFAEEGWELPEHEEEDLETEDEGL
jgi:hypothetical protein